MISTMTIRKRMKAKSFLSMVGAVLLVTLAGCGGGGGSAGTPSSGAGSTPSNSISTSTSTSTVVIGTPTVVVEIRDANNAVTTSIGGSGISTASAKLLDAGGKPVVGRLVTFTADTALVRLNPSSGSVLSDLNGVASIQISPFSFLVSGASSIKASALIDTVSVSGGRDFQVSVTNLVLRSLNVGSTSLAAFGNRAISVQVAANGTPVTSPVQVVFTASCGSASPASVNTDGAGNAATSYKADVIACAGTNVTISASSVGATPLSGQISVLPTVATNIQFVSTAPAVIYLRDSGAATQAVVTFKVVDANGIAQPNQALAVSLVNSGSGVSLDTLGANSQIIKTSDAAGNVSVAVFSGTVPTPVQVRAVLVANNLISTTSGILTVASGRPVQKAASISAEKLSIEGGQIDGETTGITFRIADRQGNPVPDGTVVNFVSQSGAMIPPVCVIAGGTSQCKSEIRSQGTRTENGRVSVLAYVQGEEDFVDSNGNNVYDAGEAFSDLGNAYRNSVASVTSTSYQTSDFSVPRSGAVACSGGNNGVPNTCDGVWGAVDVRGQIVIVFATSGANIYTTTVSLGETTTIPKGTATITVMTRLTVFVADKKGNSMPTGSTIAASKSSASTAGSECTVKRTLPALVPNAEGPLQVDLDLEKCSIDDAIDVVVTTPTTKTGTSNTFKLK